MQMLSCRTLDSLSSGSVFGSVQIRLPILQDLYSPYFPLLFSNTYKHIKKKTKDLGQKIQKIAYSCDAFSSASQPASFAGKKLFAIRCYSSMRLPVVGATKSQFGNHHCNQHFGCSFNIQLLNKLLQLQLQPFFLYKF